MKRRRSIFKNKLFWYAWILFALVIVMYQVLRPRVWPDFQPNSELSARLAKNSPLDQMKPLSARQDTLAIQRLISQIEQADPISHELIRTHHPLEIDWSPDSTKAALLLATSPFDENRGVVIWFADSQETRWLPINALHVPIFAPGGDRLAYIVPTSNPNRYPFELKIFDLPTFTNKAVFRSRGQTQSSGLLRILGWASNDHIVFRGTQGGWRTTDAQFTAVLEISTRQIGLLSTE